MLSKSKADISQGTISGNEIGMVRQLDTAIQLDAVLIEGNMTSTSRGLRYSVAVAAPVIGVRFTSL